MKQRQTAKQSNQCLSIIEQQIQKRFNNPQDLVTSCTCSICQSKYELKIKGKTFLRQTSSLLRLDSSKMRHFLTMISGIDHNTYLRMQIPSICFFEHGLGKQYFKTKTYGVMKEQLNYLNQNMIIRLYIDQKKKMVKNPQQTISELNNRKHHHIKFFNTIIPSYRHDVELLKQKQTSYIFHNDDKLQGQAMLSLTRGSFEQICIVKYMNKGFELLNQKQLRNLLKSTMTKDIDFIQTYIKPKEKQQAFFFTDYSGFQPLDNQFMYNRSLQHIRTDINLITPLSPNYIPSEKLQQYQNILKQMPTQYCLYKTYKIIHYMQIIRDVKVTKLDTVWIKQQTDQICFFGLLGFDYDENEKFTVDVNLNEIKEMMDGGMSDIEKQLMRMWQKMKKKKINFQQVPHEMNQQFCKQLDSIKNQSMTRKKKTKSRKGSTVLGSTGY